MELYEKRKKDDPNFQIGDSVVCSQDRGNNVLLTIEGTIIGMDDVFVTIKDKYGDIYDFDKGETTKLDEG
jgi:hypothetical protein